MEGILLVGHGSLLDHANDGLFQVANDIRQRSEYKVVEVSFLDLSKPDIPTGVLTCVKKGVTHLIVVPYFLTEGLLMRKAEKMVKEEAGNYRGMTMDITVSIGFDPRIIQVVKDRIQEAMGE